MNALVFGGAACIRQDLARVPRDWADIRVAVNDIGTRVGRLDHWCSLHPDRFDRWESQRAALGLNDSYQLWTRVPPYPVHKRIGRCRQTRHWGGGSGLLAVKVALEQGADRVLLCGMPLSRSPHFTAQTEWGGEPWPEWWKFLGDWASRYHVLKDRVRSMSGNTRDMFGAPDEEWLGV